MESKKIYLIRHGETEYNRKGIVQGSGVDAPLNELGIRQAEAFYNAYGHLQFDRVYTSVLIRSIQSVQRFLDLDLPHTALPELNEIHWGKKEGVEATKADHDYYMQVTAQWRNGRTDLPIEGGESPDDVMERQRPALKHILDQTEEKQILICMHGRAMKIFLCLMMGYPLREMDQRFNHANLCLYQLDYKNGAFDILLHNDVQHLNGLK